MADLKNPLGPDALDKLAARVAEAKQDIGSRESKAALNRSGMDMGLRMASEFASAILVGGLLGFGVDYVLKTMPLAFFIGLGLGFAAGTVNLIRVSRNYANTHSSGTDLSVSSDDDSKT